jgi:hypothetical protein
MLLFCGKTSGVGLTFAQFFAWNPVIGSKRTDLDLVEAYCVGFKESG